MSVKKEAQQFSIEDLTQCKLTETPLKIESIKILNGANYFSAGPVIRFRLNLGELDEVFSNTIDGFFDYLKESIPSLYEHHCSLGVSGGFFTRVKEGTLLGHIMEHVTIELQHLAGMEVAFGKTRETKQKGFYNVLFRFVDEIAGIYAGKSAVCFLNAFFNKETFDIQKTIRHLILIREKRLLGPSTQAIVDEAESRGIPVIRHDKYNLVQLGTGKYRKLIRATVTEDTNLIAVETVENKFRTTKLLHEAGIPVPETIITDKPQEVIDFYTKNNFPIVVKPAFGNRGKGVNIGLNEKQNILKACEWAKQFDEDLIAQKDIPGVTYRLLVIDFKFVAAVRLIPPYILGDGISTVAQLIEKLNNEPEREIGDKGKLSKVEIDDNSHKILELLGYTSESILPENEIVYLKNSGNLQLGGKSIDVTEEVDPYNKFMVERASQILNLNVAGVDVVSENIAAPFIQNNGKIIEVNAAPDFRMHFNPTQGKTRLVQKDFVSMLFKEEDKATIPVYSVTGSKGKNIVVRIMEKCLKNKGVKTGIASRFGLYTGEHCLKNGDATDSKNVEIILKDPTIDCAILETPVEAILESGLGYEYANIGIVLNLVDDKKEYYSYDHIRDIEDVSYAKSVVAEMVYDEGYTILNADDELVYSMSERLYSKLVLFSKKTGNAKVRQLTEKGGIAVILDEMDILVLNNKKRIKVLNLGNIPAIATSLNTYDIDAVLAAVAALYLIKIPVEEIIEILKVLDL